MASLSPPKIATIPPNVDNVVPSVPVTKNKPSAISFKPEPIPLAKPEIECYHVAFYLHFYNLLFVIVQHIFSTY